MSPYGPSRAAVRRRRLVAFSVIVLVLVLALTASAMLAGGEQPPPLHFALPGGSVQQLPVPSAHLQRGSGRPFSPAPAAVAAAARMSLASQVAQLFMVDVHGQGPVGTEATAGWGGMVLTRTNYASPTQMQALTTTLAGRVRSSGAPRPLIAATQRGGSHTALPGLPPQGQTAVGATGDPSVERAQALAAGRRLRAVGISMTLAPLADVDVPSGILDGELFGSDPKTVARFTQAGVAGYRAAGIAAAVGHFPGEGDATVDPEQGPASVGGSLSDLESRDVVPFAAVSSQAPVMLMSNAAYVAFDGVTPASVSPQAIALLRRTLGFRGVIMSGDLGAALQPTGETLSQISVSALQAGDDLLYVTGSPDGPQTAYVGLLTAARHSAAIRSKVHAALLEVLTLKARYGLL